MREGGYGWRSRWSGWTGSKGRPSFAEGIPLRFKKATRQVGRREIGGFVLADTDYLVSRGQKNSPVSYLCILLSVADANIFVGSAATDPTLYRHGPIYGPLSSFRPSDRSSNLRPYFAHWTSSVIFLSNQRYPKTLFTPTVSFCRRRNVSTNCTRDYSDRTGPPRPACSIISRHYRDAVF